VGRPHGFPFEIVSRSPQAGRLEGLDQRRDNARTGLAHLLSALGMIAIALAQHSSGRRLDVLAHEAMATMVQPDPRWSEYGEMGEGYCRPSVEVAAWGTR